MRVAFIARSTLYSFPGGDTTQVTSTAKYLRLAGIHVDIILSTTSFEYDLYDLLHFFNVIRPADILKHIRSGRPYVVSTIYVNYAEYDKKHRKGVAGIVFKFLPPAWIEYSKTIARYITGKDAIASGEYLWLGHRLSIKKILLNAACLLPNSESEYKRLIASFRIKKKYVVVPNGIDTDVFPPADTAKDPLMVLCVARIEGIKNQLNLVRALSGSRYKLYLIGDPAPHQIKYYEACRREAASNIVFINNLPQPALREYYAKAKVHVLPSWFETTGLTSLEAAAMGCNIVISNRGDAKEYFRDNAFYCDPASPPSILKAVENAATREPNARLQSEIRTKFTWQQAAFITIQAYRAI